MGAAGETRKGVAIKAAKGGPQAMVVWKGGEMIPPHKITGAVAKHCASELALGYLRYEALKKLNIHGLSVLHERNIVENIPFDALVDELIEKDGK